MAPTYTRRNRSELNAILRHTKEEDLLKKAEMLAGSSDPDAIFSGHEIRKSSPVGVLVLFGSDKDREKEMPEAARCDSLDDIERMLGVLQAYPKVGDEYFEEKRIAYIREVQRMRKVSSNTSSTADKERHRLENAVRNADIQKAWLVKENTDRLNKIRTIEEEIRGYEEQLSQIQKEFPDNTAEIQKAIEATGPIKKEIEEDTARLRELSARITDLHAEQSLVDVHASPMTARLQKMEEERLSLEQESLTRRIEISSEKLRRIEIMIERLRTDDRAQQRFNEITSSLNKSRLNLAQAQNELDGGTKMVDNLDLRVQILGGRLKALKASDSLPDAKQNARIAVLARAEELLNAWISSSRVLKEILAVDGISGKELVEALFFANGPMCACGEDACTYLDAIGASLDTLMLYGTDEEHPGFWHIEVFE